MFHLNIRVDTHACFLNTQTSFNCKLNDTYRRYKGEVVRSKSPNKMRWKESPLANEWQVQKRKMEWLILHLPSLETAKGLDSSPVLKNNHFKDLSEQYSIIQNWRALREKLQKYIKALESRTTEKDLQRSNYLVYQREGERGILITA